MSDMILNIAASIMILSLILSFIRFFKGPKTVNRVVSMDVIGFIAISLIGFISLIVDRSVFLDVALVYGLLSFLGVIVLARYVEGGL
jgi:multicomponent Na+:H+ antiporter subunit F